MKINAMTGISNFSRPIETPPANLPNKNTGVIPANDNLKHENVQVSVNSMAPEFHETPSGQKTQINFLA